MTLTDRINRREATPTVVPLVERRQGSEVRLPEWRRRAEQQIARAGGRYIAVTDLTEAA